MYCKQFFSFQTTRDLKFQANLVDSSAEPTLDHSLAGYGLDASLSGASDLEIARALQEKFDLEQAAILRAEEERRDPSKGSNCYFPNYFYQNIIIL